MARMKVVITGIIVAFLVFYIMTSPDHAASIVHNTCHVAVNVAHGGCKFFDTLS